MTVPADDSARPALVTVPNIPILSVGSWAGAFGVFTCTSDDLHAAVAAFDDPGYSRPLLKLGHFDDRFNTAAPCDPPGDGQPAIGRLINPRVTDDGMTLVVDIAGVPAWIADIMPTAWPSRSIEGRARHKTQTGTVHRFALTGLALLGVEAPAVSTLADIATLFGLDPVAVAASAADSLTEEPMSQPIAVAASVNLDTVRQQYYSDENQRLRLTLGGSWSWIREVYSDFVVVDDDEGHLYRVPWSESPDKPGEVVFGEPTQVRVEYVDQAVAASVDSPVADALRRGGLRARLAAMAAGPAVTPADPTEPDAPDPQPPANPPATPTTPPPPGGVPNSPGAEPEPSNTRPMEDNVSDLSEIARGLGLPDDAGKDAILAALAERKPADPPATEPTPDPEPSDSTPATPAPQSDRTPELVAASAKTDVALSELKRLSEELAAIKAEKATATKTALFDGAVAAGKLRPADRQAWEGRYDKAPEVIADVLASIAPGTAVPVSPAGYTGTGDEAVDADFDALMARLDGPYATSKGV